MNSHEDCFLPKKRRRELKFLLGPDRLYDLQPFLSRFMDYDASCRQVSDHSYQVITLYFDSPGRESFHDKVNGQRTRRKFRFRFYRFSPGELFMEIKEREGPWSVKRRRKVTLGHGGLAGLWDEMSQWRALRLRPLVWVSYRRSAWQAGDSSGVRLTLDQDLHAGRFHGFDLDAGDLEPVLAPALRRGSILELKLPAAVPYWLTPLLQTVRDRRRPLSKYRIAYSYLHPRAGG